MMESNTNNQHPGGYGQRRSPEEMAKFSAERAAALHTHILSLPPSTHSQFSSDPWSLISTIEDFARKERLPMIFQGEKMQLACTALKGVQPPAKYVVEFGTFVGCSAIAWGATLLSLHPTEQRANIHVYTFEMMPENVRIARDMLKLAGLDDIVTVLEGPGAESLKKLVGEGKVQKGEVDMVFLDHWEKFYVSDLQLCEQLGLFRVGSIVVADNTDFPGAPDYVRYVKQGGNMGRGAEGGVRYESESLEAHAAVASHGPGARRPVPKIVEVTRVVAV